MKPVAFAYERPASLAQAIDILRQEPGAKILAGGQTLNPMLNLRLARPDVLVAVAHLEEMLGAEQDDQALTLGACITHGAIEDGRVPDVTHGLLPAVAKGIAYRAVRTCGTIGGSLAHADPAADWLSCLTALDAELVIQGADGARREPVASFMSGVFQTSLRADEVLSAVRVPKLSPGARTGFFKITRKVGEFAEAIGVAVHDPQRGATRLVCGALDGPPALFEGADPLVERLASGQVPETSEIAERLAERQIGGDAVGRQIHAVALKRAIEEACAS